MTEGSPTNDQADLGFAKTLAAQGILNYIEGGNENDSAWASTQGNSMAWTAKFQQQVYAVGHSLGLPVINMSFGFGWTDQYGDYDNVGDLSPYADYANAHTYPSPGGTPGSRIPQLNADAQLAAKSRPVITTEIGYDTSKVTQAAAAKLVLDTVFDGIKYGNPKTYFYALLDDSSGKWGLMNANGTPKPAGTAVHNLMSLLADTGAKTGSLSYSLTGTATKDNSLLMEKSNGRFLSTTGTGQATLVS